MCVLCARDPRGRSPVREVTAYRCQDASTARILEQIIQETTNRMNRLSQQESENEIKMFAMSGEIEQETRRAEASRGESCDRRISARDTRARVERKVTARPACETVAIVVLVLQLLKVLQTHKLMEAANEGEAEAARVRAFLAETARDVPELKQRIAIWHTLRKQDALEAVSAGDARLYFTPNDVNLSIETKET